MLVAATGFVAAQYSQDAAGASTAIQKITITYKDEADALTPFERGLAEFNGLRYCEVHLDTPRTIKSLTQVVCRGGKTTETPLTPEGFGGSTVSEIRFYARGFSADSVKIMLDKLMSMKIQLPNNESYILMETYDAEDGAVIPGESAGDFSVEYAPGAAVPLIAYTTGLLRNFKIGDVEVSGIDYCGLRDKHVHPSRWGEFGIDNYVYYVAKFE
jgi:hypothetical protein